MTDFYAKLTEKIEQGTPMIVVTAVEKEGEGPVEVGKKMGVTDESTFGTVGGGALEHYAINQAKKLLKQRTHLMEKYYLNHGEIIPSAKTLPMVCGGIVTLFYEYIGPKNTVYIFGAGHVGQALSNVLNPLSFYLIAIDPRKDVLDRLNHVQEKHQVSFVEYIQKHGIQENSFVIVCTPSHAHDYHVLHHIIEAKYLPKYIGMLCSPTKLRDYLNKTYESFGKDLDLSHFYSPIGLDTGGGSPEEIAISIAAEILAIHHGKKGHKHMRENLDDHDHYWKHQ